MRPANSDLRVLYLVSGPRISLGPRSSTPGATAHITGFVRGLRALGADVEVLASSELPGLGRAGGIEDSQTTGGTIRLFAQDVVRLVVATYVAAARWSTRRRHRPHIVYERYATFYGLGRAWQRSGALWIVECNGIFYEQAANDRRNVALWRIARWHEGRVLRRADRVVTVTAEMKRQVVDKLGVSADRIVVCPNGIDPADFDNVVRQQRPSGHVGFVGQLYEWQGLDDLIAAIVSLPEHRCTIVGDGRDRARLEELAHRLGVAERVRFTGAVPRPAAIEMMGEFTCGYAGHRAASGDHYHSPLKVYEYAAAGLPIVTTVSEAQRELSNVCPVFEFREGDIDELVEQIKRADVAVPRSEIAAAVAERCSWRARVAGLLTAVGVSDELVSP